MEKLILTRETAEEAVQKIYELLGVYSELVRLLQEQMDEKEFEKAMSLIGDSYTPMDKILKIIFDQFPDLSDKMDWK